jgi:hypothetical protein
VKTLNLQEHFNSLTKNSAQLIMSARSHNEPEVISISQAVATPYIGKVYGLQGFLHFLKKLLVCGVFGTHPSRAARRRNTHYGLHNAASLKMYLLGVSLNKNFIMLLSFSPKTYQSWVS